MPAQEEAALLAGLAMAAAGTAQRAGSEEAQRCSVCRAALPSRHLLDLHLEEVHDSFFAAQVARKLKVGIAPTAALYCCLCFWRARLLLRGAGCPQAQGGLGACRTAACRRLCLCLCLYRLPRGAVLLPSSDTAA